MHVYYADVNLYMYTFTYRSLYLINAYISLVIIRQVYLSKYIIWHYFYIYLFASVSPSMCLCLSISDGLPVCLSVSLSLAIYIYIYISKSIYLNLSFYLSLLCSTNVFAKVHKLYYVFKHIFLWMQVQYEYSNLSCALSPCSAIYIYIYIYDERERQTDRRRKNVPIFELRIVYGLCVLAEILISNSSCFLSISSPFKLCLLLWQ